MEERRPVDWKFGALVAAVLLSLAACVDFNQDNGPQLDWLSKPAPRANPGPGPTYFTVRVRPGDTLGAIAGRYQVTSDGIARLNGIADSNAIHPGEVLRIPAGSRATRDAVYADATSQPTRSNPYVPAPPPRRGGHPGGKHVDVSALPELKPQPQSSPQYASEPPPTNVVSITLEPEPAPRPPATPYRAAPEPQRTAANAAMRTPRHPAAPAWYQSDGDDGAPPAQPPPAETQPAAKPMDAQPATLKPQPDVELAQTVPGSPRFIWPVTGKVISEFGSNTNGERNDGINIAAGAGEPIHAAASGVVTYAGNELRNYGNLLFIKHDDGYITAYAHAQNIVVQKGAYVHKGQVVAYVGQTGNVSQPQLHFEIRRDLQPVNPRPLLVAAR